MSQKWRLKREPWIQREIVGVLTWTGTAKPCVVLQSDLRCRDAAEGFHHADTPSWPRLRPAGRPHGAARCLSASSEQVNALPSYQAVSACCTTRLWTETSALDLDRRSSRPHAIRRALARAAPAASAPAPCARAGKEGASWGLITRPAPPTPHQQRGTCLHASSTSVSGLPPNHQGPLPCCRNNPGVARMPAGAAGSAWRRSRVSLRVQAIAATERPASKVTSQVFELPKGSRIEVGCAAQAVCLPRLRRALS